METEPDHLPTFLKLTSVTLSSGTRVINNTAADGGGVCVVGSFHSTTYLTELVTSGAASYLPANVSRAMLDKENGYWPVVVLVEHSNVADNVANVGGGFHIENTAIMVKETNVTANQATGALGGGGAVYLTATQRWTSFLGEGVWMNANQALNGYGGTAFVVSTDKKIYNALFDLTASVVSNSTAQTFGGHIYTHGAMVQMNNVNLSSSALLNLEGSLGGSIYMKDSHLVTSLVDFDNSTATTGGCVFATASSQLDLDGTSFHNCRATSVGGALNIEEKSILTTGGVENRIYNNVAESGAGIYLTTQAYASLDNVTFAANKAEGNWGGDGAAVFVQRASVNIQHSKLLKNAAQSAGGAAYIDTRGTLTSIQGSVEWANNKAPRGGAMMIGRYATVNLWSNLFQHNEAIEAGGAVASVRRRRI